MDKTTTSEEKITRIENGEIVQTKKEIETNNDKAEAKLVLIDWLVLRKLSLQVVWASIADIDAKIEELKSEYQKL